MTAAVVGERPPSPPISNDGDFGLSAVQEHVAGLENQASPRSIRPAPLRISDPDIVSTSPVAAPTEGVVNRSDSPQDQYGDPSMYQTAQNYTYYPAQPVRGLTALETEEHANMVSAEVRTDHPPTDSSFNRVRCWRAHPKSQSAWFAT